MSITFEDIIKAIYKTTAGEMPQDPRIQQMFLKEIEFNHIQTVREDIIKQRFKRAQELYKLVDKTGINYPAFFYKLSDKQLVIDQYKKASHQIQKIFIAEVLSLHRALQIDDIPIILNNIKNSDQSNPILKEIIAHLENQKDFNELIPSGTNSLDQTSEKWFASKQTDITKMAENKYFGIDTNAAVSYGCIYAPGTSEVHNWGINTCWATASIANNRTIHLLSELVNIHARRRGQIQSGTTTLLASNNNNSSTAPPSTLTALGNTYQSSAFALEIAIAIKMGYGLTFEQHMNKITLVPPDKYHFDDNFLEHTIPTREEQIRLYDQCVLAKELHDKLKDNSLQKYMRDCFNASDVDPKINLVAALEILRVGDSLQPILNALSFQEFAYLEHLIKIPQLKNDNKFSELEKVIKMHKEWSQKKEISASTTPQSATIAHSQQQQQHVTSPTTATSQDNRSQQVSDDAETHHKTYK